MKGSSCMATDRLGETGFSDSGASSQHLSYELLHGIPPPSSNFIDQQDPAFEFGELEEALVPKLLQGAETRHDGSSKSFFSVRPTLEIFPSWPMRFQQTTPSGNSRSAESTDSGQNTASCKVDAPIETESPVSNKGSYQSTTVQNQKLSADIATAVAGNLQPRTLEKRKGGDGSKTPDPKTLRRLAQNREAAKKSRLRKKLFPCQAYVQQLESSRMKLTQLEQDLQRARSQGVFLGEGAGGNATATSGTAIFDMEYGRWLEENGRHMSELRRGLHAHLGDGSLRMMVDGCVSHYDEMFRLKGAAAKSDVFHLITGMWTTPAERCFLWMGGFRPSELVKILMPQLEPLTEQQFMGIYSLQQSSQQAEEALSQGLEQLQHSLADTVANGSLSEGNQAGDYMNQMILALSKLSNLEGFVYQADNLRQQSLHQMVQILTVRQAARCFLAIGEYHSRLRALSSLWTSRPRETVITEESSCQTPAELVRLQPAQSHFSSL